MIDRNAEYVPHYYDRDSHSGLAVPSVRSIRVGLLRWFSSSYVCDPSRSTWGIYEKYAMSVEFLDPEKWDTSEWYNYDYNDISAELVDITAKIKLAPIFDGDKPQWNSPLAESFTVSFSDNGEDVVFAEFLVDAKTFNHVKKLIRAMLNMFGVKRSPYLPDPEIEMDVYNGDTYPSVRLCAPFYCKTYKARELDDMARRFEMNRW